MLRPAIVVLGMTVAAGACGGSTAENGTLTIYTSVTQNTVDAVVAGFEQSNPEVSVEVFRAPTGEVNARLAVERETGGIEADVLWMTDPLSMFAYDEQGLLGEWEPQAAAALPDGIVERTFWGTRLLHMVVVAGDGVVIDEWSDLIDPSISVVLPDPSLAGSAFATLGYFATSPDFGFGFYRAIASNGGVQVPSPGDVVTAVAEDRFDAGISLDFSVRRAVDDGSPVQRIWPRPGAITLYSPIGIVEGSDRSSAARDFVDYVLTEEGQSIIGETGWVPARPGVPGPPVPPGAEELYPDWAELWARQSGLLDGYRAIFDG